MWVLVKVAIWSKMKSTERVWRRKYIVLLRVRVTGSVLKLKQVDRGLGPKKNSAAAETGRQIKGAIVHVPEKTKPPKRRLDQPLEQTKERFPRVYSFNTLNVIQILNFLCIVLTKKNDILTSLFFHLSFIIPHSFFLYINIGIDLFFMIILPID